MPQSPTASPSVIYRWKYRRNMFVGKVLAGNFLFWHASLVGKTVDVWFVLFPIESATDSRITDDQNFDRRIPSIKFLPTSCVSYTDRMNLSVKLFNDVV
jgi:hypothetical protein